ncbi:MAG: hypothetical protein ACRCXB_12875 [Aeromonadaceae bacterium]
MNTSITSNTYDDESITVLSIPVSKRELGGFISDLLGQKQSLERTYDVTFEIDHSWLINLHEMIDQRISQQANSHLINFTAVVYFDNGVKRTITTVNSFRAYNETKPEISNGVKIVWEYLVQFPNRPHPEKQQISFTALIYNKKPSEKSLLVERYTDLFLFSTKDSLINIQIDHTERTWGDDIENIISTCIKEVTESRRLRDTIVELSRLIMALAIFGLMTFYPIYNEINSGNDALHTLQQEYQSLIKIENIDISIINKKLDTIFDAVSQIEASKRSKTLWWLACLFFAPIITALFLAFTSSARQSHVLLSSKAIKLKDSIDKKSKNTTIIIIFSYVASIAAGIIGIYGFMFLTK